MLEISYNYVWYPFQEKAVMDRVEQRVKIADDAPSFSIDCMNNVKGTKFVHRPRTSPNCLHAIYIWHVKLFKTGPRVANGRQIFLIYLIKF